MKKLTFLIATLVLTLAVTSLKGAHQDLAYQQIRLDETTRAVIQQHAELRAQKLAEARKKAEAVKAKKKAELAKQDALRKAQQAPKPQPRVVASAGGCEQYRSIISRYNWDARVAMAVMQAESGCRASADNTGLNRNGSNDKGLMQINSVHVPHLIGDNERFNPEANIRAAYAIYSGGGWSAWSAYTNGSYAKYLR